MDELYVKCKGKARADKNTYTKEQITSPDFTDDYGRIVPPGYVVFDFDEQPYINIIHKILTSSGYKCKMLKTTKGYHFMFKTMLNKVPDGIKVFNWIGLKCDIKACGTKESKQSYQTIRLNGITREEMLINATDNWDLDYAPKWLYAISNKKKDQVDLTEDQTGGRNNLFHSELMIKAKRAGFSYDEYIEMARIINEFVIPSPLDEEELNTATRQEEWDNLEIGEDKITLIKKAEDLILFWNCILGGGEFAYFNPDENRYDTNMYPIKRYLQEKYAIHNITTNQMEEVMEQVDIILHSFDKYKVDRSEEYVLCTDKLVSVQKDEIIPNTRTVYTDVRYPLQFMEKEEFDNFNGRAKTFMEEISCGNKELELIMWECIGCMLSPIKPFGKIFIWYGSGNNGKSLLIKLIAEIMGPLMTYSNILNVNDKFALEGVVRGITNVTDDIGITVIKETGLLKSLIDGSAVEINRKFKEPVWWEPNSQFIMCCNELPRIQDTTHGMIRRLAFIPFDLHLEEDKIDRTLFQKLKADKNNLRYLMSGGIYAFRNAFKRGKLSTFEKQKELTDDFITENQDPISNYYSSLREEIGSVGAVCRWLNGRTTDDVYQKYVKWCEESAIRPITNKSFVRAFSRLLPACMKKKLISLGRSKI